MAKLSDMRIVNAELEYMVMEPRKEFITMVVLVVGNIPLLYFLNKDWYHTLMHTVVGADNAQHCRHYYFCIHSPCNQTDKTDRIQVVERRQYESDIILCVFDLFYRSLSAACRTITSADLKDQQGNDGYR